jgi:hypothetical protein
MPASSPSRSIAASISRPASSEATWTSSSTPKPATTPIWRRLKPTCRACSIG